MCSKTLIVLTETEAATAGRVARDLEMGAPGEETVDLVVEVGACV